MATKLVCSTCGFYGEPKVKSFGGRVCQKCQGKTLVPPDSPVGQRMLKEAGVSEQEINNAVSQTKKAEKRKLYFKTFVVVGLVLIFGLFMNGLISSSVPDEASFEETALITKPAFDVPSLVGKNISELKTALGKPDSDTEPTNIQIQAGINTWEKTWTKEGYTLMATYGVNTGRVTELFIGPKSGTLNKNSLLKVSNLTENTSLYSLEFIKAVNASGYTGVVVR